MSSTGIEISPEAVEWARAHAKRQISDLSDEERRKYGEVTFDVGDFYKDEWVKGPREGGFDYVYDYTVSFLIAHIHREKAESCNSFSALCHLPSVLLGRNA